MSEVPMPIADVRLVIPYEFKEYTRHGVLVEKTKDVIVDKVVMERHTTGVDPFTGTNYGSAEIPKDHQYDPTSGLPIFHRYIAGTRQRIEWPWEKQEVEDVGMTKESAADKQTFLRRTLNTLRHPIKSIQRARAKKAPEDTKTGQMDEGLREESLAAEKKRLEADRIRNPARPESEDPDHAVAYDGTDTTRNIVEGSESMQYTLVAPPFPDTLGEELRGDIQGFTAEARKNKDDTEPRAARPKRVTERSQAVSQEAKARHVAAQKMKTPMQLRWETEHAKKIKQQKTAPLVSTEDLMAALGRHIQAQKAQSVKVSEVD
jgi:large subunit ribosomal protein L24